MRPGRRTPVVRSVVPPRVPPPLAIDAVTSTPPWPLALPDRSRTWITGCLASGVPLSAVLEGWVAIESWVPAPAASVIARETIESPPGAPKRRVYDPTSPRSFRSPNVARPSDAVVRVSVPCSSPSPLSTARGDGQPADTVPRAVLHSHDDIAGELDIVDRARGRLGRDRNGGRAAGGECDGSRRDGCELARLEAQGIAPRRTRDGEPAEGGAARRVARGALRWRAWHRPVRTRSPR